MLLSIAPRGVYKLIWLLKLLVVSYTTFSPLLIFISGLFSVALSVNYLPGSYPALCSVESGLSSINRDYPFHILSLHSKFIHLNKKLLFLGGFPKIGDLWTFWWSDCLIIYVFQVLQIHQSKLPSCFLGQLHNLFHLFHTDW